MILLVTGFVLVFWLMSVAWLDDTRYYYSFYAAGVFIIWWIAWRHRTPPWPERLPYHPLLMVLTLLLTAVMAFLVGEWPAYLVPLTVLVLLLIQIRQSPKESSETS